MVVSGLSGWFLVSFVFSGFFSDQLEEMVRFKVLS